MIRSLLFFLSAACIAITASSAFAQDADNGRFAVLFNQPKYAPGDTVFFTVFNLLEDMPAKCVLNLQVQGLDGSSVFNERVLSNDGVASGQFLIANNIAPGLYNFVVVLEDGLLNTQPQVDSAPFHVVGVNETREPDNQTALARADTSLLHFELSNLVFRPRENVSLKVRTKKKQRKPVTLSITVYKSDLLTGSPLVKTVSTRAVQSPVASINQVAIPYFFAGRALNEVTSEPLPDSSKITFYLSESAIIYSVYSKKDGYFFFPLFKNFETENLFYSISRKGRPLRGFKIETYTPLIQFTPAEAEYSTTPDAYAFYAKQRSTVEKAYNYAAGETNVLLNERENEFASDHDVVLDNLGPFSTMEEMILNVVPMTKVRNGGIRMFLKKDAKYATGDPLYMVDGFLTDDTDFILRLDPKTIKKVSVLRTAKTLLRFGELGNNGILIIETETGTDSKVFERNISVRGLIQPINMSHIAPAQRRTPSLRSSLFWRGNISAGNQAAFNFDTPNDAGMYIVYGVIFFDNKIFSTTTSFEVATDK